MGKERLAAFSDGVIAIIITIMVLELKPPHGVTLADVRSITPQLFTYVLSFVNIAIYWNNHHHLLYTIDRVNGAILWANMHLLFWLSLMPLATLWMGEHYLAKAPVGVYGADLLACGAAYWLLQRAILRSHGPQSVLAAAIGPDYKGNLSPVIYTVALVSACFQPWISIALYVLVAAMWLVPDRRIERTVSSKREQNESE